MTSISQRRAIDEYRRRLAEQGLERFEVRGLDRDKELIRGIARRLAVDDDAAGALRADLGERIRRGETAPVGGILAALRRSPLVDADLHFDREELSGRDAGL